MTEVCGGAGISQEWERVYCKGRFIYSLDEDKLQFVNREDAVNELMAIHRGNYIRAVKKSGEAFYIPLCDHVNGLGKSDFGRNYIRRCQMILDEKCSQYSPFEEVLYKCQTIHVMFHSSALANSQDMEQVLIKFLSSELEQIFVKTPSCVGKSYTDSCQMLNDITKEIGPIFIVLDEMGIAFEHSTDASEFVPRQRFLDFCDTILGKWLLLRKVFFLVLGRAAFLTYVGQRPENAESVKASRTLFKRLPLRLLRVPAIQIILEKTLLDQISQKTLAQHFGLSPSQIQEVASTLFVQTNGHPRSLLRALKLCKSFQDLKDYVGDCEVEYWDQLCRRLICQKSTILKLLRTAIDCKELDMSKNITLGGKSISYDEIASNSLMAWEGTLKKATVYALPSVKAFLASLLMPFDEFVKDLNQRPESIPLNYPDAFELLLMKRFQQMFSQECEPKDVMEPFFDTAKFGGCSRVALSSDHVFIPKRDQKNPSLSSLTADPDAWPTLLSEIDSYPSICLKPASESSSPDIIFATYAWLNDKKIRLRICIAAKNYKSTELAEDGINAEIEKANRMFAASDESDQSVLNVLFICSTNYASSVQSRISGAKFYSFKYKCIHEVIVLDLTTSANRALFFGSNTQDWMSSTIEAVIEKGKY
jgi:AraC-like DNA-binding protein